MGVLHKALEERRFRQFRILLEIGANVNELNLDLQTPLMRACFLDDHRQAKQIIKSLLSRGAKVELKDKFGMTALSYACHLGKMDLIIEMLSNHEIDVNSFDNEGNTALHHAVISGNIGAVEMVVAMLKKYSLSVDCMNQRGETPMILAARLGHTACTAFLLSEGKASPYARDQVYYRSFYEWEKIVSESSPQERAFSAKSLEDKRKDERFPVIQRDSVLFPSRPSTAPYFVNGTFQQQYKDEFRKLIHIYQKQISDSYRPAAIRPPTPAITEESDGADNSTDAENMNNSEDTPRGKLTVSKAATLAMNASLAIKRRPSLMARGSASFSEPRQLMNKKNSQNSPVVRRGSINVMQKMRVPLAFGKIKDNKNKIASNPFENLAKKLQVLDEVTDMEE